MTEAEWLPCDDPFEMQTFLVEKATGERRWWLHFVACCRTAWHELSDDRSRKFIEVAERYADGLIPEDEWRNARRMTEVVVLDPLTSTDTDAAEAAAWPVGTNTTVVTIAVEGEVQCGFFRDIFGNPFRPITVDPRWLTSTVIPLAEVIYADRAFDRLPVLADALQDAGCEDADLLEHCRGPGPHARGCWVVDLVLGKQ